MQKIIIIRTHCLLVYVIVKVTPHQKNLECDNCGQKAGQV
jgi:hypothetical protein